MARSCEVRVVDSAGFSEFAFDLHMDMSARAWDVQRSHVKSKPKESEELVVDGPKGTRVDDGLLKAQAEQVLPKA